MPKIQLKDSTGKVSKACGRVNEALLNIDKAAKILRDCGFHNEADSLSALTLRGTEIIYQQVLPANRSDSKFFTSQA